MHCCSSIVTCRCMGFCVLYSCKHWIDDAPDAVTDLVRLTLLEIATDALPIHRVVAASDMKL